MNFLTDILGILTAFFAALAAYLGVKKNNPSPPPPPPPTPTTVPPPASGLGSNSNYIFANDCNPITGLNVKMTTTQDMVSSNGFGEQINCYSPVGQTTAYPQFGFLIDPTGQLSVFVDTWPISGDNLLNDFVALYKFPNSTLPAGYILQSSFEYDSNNNITGIWYSLSNPSEIVAQITLMLSTISGFQPSYLCPITCFETNIVGPYNGESTFFSSGAGTIEYDASTPLSVLNSLPSCVETTAITAETSNIVDGAMSTPATEPQVFGINTTAMIMRLQKTRQRTNFKGITPRQPTDQEKKARQ